MIGVVLVAHMRIASETKAAVEYILQQQQASLIAVDVINSDDTAIQQQRLQQSLSDMAQDCDAILVMTDVFGATPCNMVRRVIVQGHINADIELIAGFNVPTVIKAILERQHHSLETMTQLSLAAGQKYLRMGSQGVVVKRKVA